MCVAAAADSLRLSLGLLPSLGFCSGCVRVVAGVRAVIGFSWGCVRVVFGLLPALGLSLGFLGVVFGLLRFCSLCFGFFVLLSWGCALRLPLLGCRPPMSACRRSVKV